MVTEERCGVGTRFTTTIGDYKDIVAVTVPESGTTKDKSEVTIGVESDDTLDEDPKEKAI